MPELPEVETVVRDLRAALPGLRIGGIRVYSHFVADASLELLPEQKIAAVSRHGKFIAICCDGGVLAVHLGMTGRLLLHGDCGKHTRVEFGLSQGRVLLFDDIRMFGRVTWDPRLPRCLRHLGPDALAITEREFVDRVASRRRQLKPLLLDQAFIAGLGNIYVDEILFRTGLHPSIVAADVPARIVRRLHHVMLETLEAAIAARGSSISDYVDASNRPGSFQLQHLVYCKEGVPCSKCGTPIMRILIAQRGTHICPRCQKL